MFRGPFTGAPAIVCEQILWLTGTSISSFTSFLLRQELPGCLSWPWRPMRVLVSCKGPSVERCLWEKLPRTPGYYVR